MNALLTELRLDREERASHGMGQVAGEAEEHISQLVLSGRHFITASLNWNDLTVHKWLVPFVFPAQIFKMGNQEMTEYTLSAFKKSFRAFLYS